MNDPAKQRFLRTIDALEQQLDKGFFLSFINKIVVDEKRIFTIINELRSLASDQFDHAPEAAPEPERPAPPPPAEPAPNVDAQEALQQAEAVRRDADNYADGVLSDLEDRLRAALDDVARGRQAVQERTQAGGEPNGSAQI